MERESVVAMDFLGIEASHSKETSENERAGGGTLVRPKPSLFSFKASDHSSQSFSTSLGNGPVRKTPPQVSCHQAAAFLRARGWSLPESKESVSVAEAAPGKQSASTERSSSLDKPLEELTDADIMQLTREDCRRYLKEKADAEPTGILAVDAATNKMESSILTPAEIEHTPSKPNEGFIEEWLKAADSKMNRIFQEFYYMRDHFTAVKEENKNLRAEMAKIRNEMAQIRGVETHMMGEITAFKDKQPILPTPAIDHETSSKIKELEQKIDKESKTWASLFKAKESNDTSMVTAKGNSSLPSSPSLVSATINEEKLRTFKGLNICIRGVQDNGNVLEEAQSFVRDTLGQDASGIEKAWRMRQDTKILIVRFVSKTARLSTLRQRPKLMGTQLFMDDDLTHMQVEERRQAFAKGKELGKKVVYRDGQIRFFDIKASSSAK